MDKTTDANGAVYPERLTPAAQWEEGYLYGFQVADAAARERMTWPKDYLLARLARAESDSDRYYRQMCERNGVPVAVGPSYAEVEEVRRVVVAEAVERSETERLSRPRAQPEVAECTAAATALRARHEPSAVILAVADLLDTAAQQWAAWPVSKPTRLDIAVLNIVRALAGRAPLKRQR